MKLGRYAQTITSAVLFCSLGASFSPPTHASPAGDECRKEICDGAVAGCMQANLSVNLLASTASEKKAYCDQFFAGCMTRSITADFNWYSPETVQRFLKQRLSQCSRFAIRVARSNTDFSGRSHVHAPTDESLGGRNARGGDRDHRRSSISTSACANAK